MVSRFPFQQIKSFWTSYELLIYKGCLNIVGQWNFNYKGKPYNLQKSYHALGYIPMRTLAYIDSLFFSSLKNCSLNKMTWLEGSADSRWMTLNSVKLDIKITVCHWITSDMSPTSPPVRHTASQLNMKLVPAIKTSCSSEKCSLAGLRLYLYKGLTLLGACLR